MRITTPTPGTTFWINADAAWPNMPFQTDASGAHSWSWSIAWKSFTASGNATTSGNTWDAQAALAAASAGGDLKVRADAGGASAYVIVKVLGTNPTAGAIRAYLATRPNSGGFERILIREASGRQFYAPPQPARPDREHGIPVWSFDNGYGMCQLTTPRPTIAQVWNWKRNVDGGLALFAVKRTAAINYLSQSGRTYTNDQLEREALCRWNGGPYHVWNAARSVWERNSNILCVAAHRGRFRNRGWNMTDAANTGRTEEQLYTRDQPFNPDQRGKNGHQWLFSGVCYADRFFD